MTERRAQRARIANVSSLLGVLVALAAAPELDAQGWGPSGPGNPEGRIRFLNIADSDFDPYSHDPTTAEQLWMRRHYSEMLTYQPYFDTRLSWYPRAWVYKDLYGIKPDWDVFDDHPEWILRDAAGNMLYIPFHCSNGECPQYAGDHGHPDYRAWWMAEAKRLQGVGYGGIWVDDVNLTWRVSDGNGDHVTPIDPRTGQEMSLDAWRRSFAEFTEEIQAAVPEMEIVHNVIWYAVPTDDPSFRRQVAASDVINLERGLNDEGLRGGNGRFGVETFLAFIDLIHTLGKPLVIMDYAETELEREYGLAGFLLVSDGRDRLASDQLAWTAPDQWWPGYELDLGPAQGARREWSGLLRRDFEAGIVLLNQPDFATRTVRLPGLFWTLDGQLVHRVTLEAKRGVVLLRPR